MTEPGFIPPGASLVRGQRLPSVDRSIVPLNKASVGPSIKGALANQGLKIARDYAKAQFGENFSNLNSQQAQAAINYAKRKAQDLRSRRKPPSGNGKGKSNNMANKGYLSHLPKQPGSTVNLRTGIKPQAFYKRRPMTAGYNKCSPLHIYGLRLVLADVSSSHYDWYRDSLMAQVQNKIQQKIGWSINLTDLSQDNILSAIQSVVTAVEIYNFMYSIVNYVPVGVEYQNEGMSAMQLDLAKDSSTYALLRKLHDTLLTAACPKRIITLCRYLQGNYLSGNGSETQLMKIIPYSVTTNNGYKLQNLINTGVITSAIDSLSTVTHRKVFNRLIAAVPSWTITESDLQVLSEVQPYNPEMLSVLNNSAYVVESDNYPRASTEYEDIEYLARIDYNNYDLLHMSLVSIYNDSGNLRTGILLPTEIKGDNSTFSRLSYYESVSGGNEFYYDSEFCIENRGDTYTTTYKSDGLSGIIVDDYDKFTHKIGTEMIEGVNSLAVGQCIEKLLIWLYDLDAIPVNLKPNSSRSRTK
jgi:hypothetical protein